ncbi:MAG: PEGA domain-containing protein [Thermoguttaceae bacterium]
MSWQIAARLTVPVLCLALVSGCVRRRMTIRTNPPGAVVFVDDYQIGTTPISTNFVHYGTRKIRIAKDGYETLTVDQPIPAPWYQIPPIDFVADTLVPAEIQDHRTLDYQLVPQRVVPPDELRGRADDFRIRARVPGADLASFNAGPTTAPTYRGPGSPVSPVPSSGPPPAGYGYPPTTVPAVQPVQPPGGYGYPQATGPAAQPAQPPAGYGYPPAAGPAAQAVQPPPGSLPPSVGPYLPPGQQTLPPGGVPLR